MDESRLPYSDIIEEIDALEKMIGRMDISMAKGG